MRAGGKGGEPHIEQHSSPHPLPPSEETGQGRQRKGPENESSSMTGKSQTRSTGRGKDCSDDEVKELSTPAFPLNAARVPYRRGNFRYLDTEVRPWGTTEGGAWRRARWALHLSRFDRSPAIVGPAEPASIATCQGVGYRTVLASDGLSCGCPFSYPPRRRAWYWETSWKGAHLRLGVALPEVALHGPLGVDMHGWAICSRDGGTFHAGIRSVDGEPFTEHDIIGCLLVGGTEAAIIASTPLPQETRARGRGRGRRRKLVSYYGAYLEERIDKYDEDEDAASLPREGQRITANHNAASCSSLKIYKNGRQIHEIALSLREPHYYPAFSLYPGTSIEVNWGPTFMYPPPLHQSLPSVPLYPSAKVQQEMLIEENLFDLLHTVGNLHEKARENNKS